MEIGDLKKKFIELYDGNETDLRVFSSPGRVNLIGEHTDYNGGFVFPAALSVASTIVVRKRNDRIVNLAATTIGDKVSADLDKLDQYKNLKWGNYQIGVYDELQKAGYKLTGCDILHDDNVPFGAGLSSSAAIEVVNALAMSTLGDPSKKINMVEMALISQKAENNYVGVKCGIMDQFASAMGKKNHAIFLNCKTMDYKLVPINLKDCKIIITNTNKKRSLMDSKYNERRGECETGLEILKKYLPKITCLGDVSASDFEKYKNEIKDNTVRMRVEHIIYEDDRVLQSVKSLHDKDIKKFGKLMIESHNSLRDLYNVTGIELDTLVAEALKIDGVIGSRMTGAGFGGCTVSIVLEKNVQDFIKIVGEEYTKKIGYAPTFYTTEIGDGGREI